MKYVAKKLKNGLKLATITGLSTNAVTVAAFVRGGFRFDPEERSGLSHFTEHIIFNAEKKDLVTDIERCGGWHSAFTWIEHQEHMVHLPGEYFEKGMRLTLESIFNPSISKEEIKKEKGVVKEEILRNKADPSKAIWDYAWFPLFFQGTNLARPYSGTTEDVSKISKDDVELFTAKYFCPENVTIFVAGNLEQSYIEKIVGKYNTKQKNNLNKRDTFAFKFKRNNHIFIHEDSSYYQTSLAIGIPTVSFNDPLKHVFDIISDMLAGYFGTTLIQRLRDEGGLIYTWNAFQDNLSDTGYLLFNVTVAHENVNRVVSIVTQEFKRLSEGKFTDDEIEMAKSHLIGSILANTETGQDYIKWYSLQEVLGSRKADSIKNKIEIYKKISNDKIRKTAERYFTKENIFIAVVGKANKASLSKLI